MGLSFLLFFLKCHGNISGMLFEKSQTKKISFTFPRSRPKVSSIPRFKAPKRHVAVESKASLVEKSSKVPEEDQNSSDNKRDDSSSHSRIMVDRKRERQEEDIDFDLQIEISPKKTVAESVGSLETLPDDELAFTPHYQSPQSMSSQVTNSGFELSVDFRKVCFQQYFLSCPQVFKHFDSKYLAKRYIQNVKVENGDETQGFVPLFAKQIGVNGSQSFVVCGYRTFYSAYKSMSPGERVYYEIFQERGYVKCFVDYDSKTTEMTREEFEERVSLLNRIISDQLLQRYGVNSSVLVLDSSNHEKWSKHVIWNTANAMFKDVYHLKAFIHLCSVIASKSHPRYINDFSRSLFGILDANVYKLGAYRLYGSTKYGQERYLLRCTDQMEDGVLDESTFYKSLVCHFPALDRILMCKESEKSAYGVSRNHEVLKERRGINGLPLHVLKKILEECRTLDSTDLFLVCKRWYYVLSGRFVVNEETHRILEASLREMLIRNHGQKQGEVVSEKSIFFFGEYGVCFVFGQKSHNCELQKQWKGREHFRNTIYWVCFPDLGVYYQKCHDADCKAMQIEKSVQPDLGNELKVSFEEEDEDEVCILTNGSFGVCCPIASKGRGIVREIPRNVILCIPPFENERNVNGKVLVVTKLIERQEIIVKEMDLVSFENEDTIFVVKEIYEENEQYEQDESPIKACLKELDDENVIQVGKKDVNKLKLMGALLIVKRKNNSNSNNKKKDFNKHRLRPRYK